MFKNICLIFQFFVDILGMFGIPPSPTSMSKFPSGGNKYEKMILLIFIDLGRCLAILGPPPPSPSPTSVKVPFGGTNMNTCFSFLCVFCFL